MKIIALLSFSSKQGKAVNHFEGCLLSQSGPVNPLTQTQSNESLGACTHFPEFLHGFGEHISEVSILEKNENHGHYNSFRTDYYVLGSVQTGLSV